MNAAMTLHERSVDRSLHSFACHRGRVLRHRCLQAAMDRHGREPVWLNRKRALEQCPDDAAEGPWHHR